MPSIIPKNYFCPSCKKDITKKICDCGTKGKPQPPYSVRFRWVDENGIVKNMRITDEQGGGWLSRAAAQRGYDEWIAKHPLNKKPDNRTVDFLPLYEEYKSYLMTNVKESSALMFLQRINIHVLPYFHNKKVTEIKSADIIKWQAAISDLDLTYEYKKSIRSAFNHFFSYLKIYGFDNPLSKVKGFKKLEQKKEMLFWTQDEFETFIACVDDFRYKVVFAFLYLMGCRKGEALALKWSDIDFDAQTAYFHATLTRATDTKRLKNEGELLGANYRLTTPKTENSYRRVIIPTQLMIYMKELKENATSEFVFGTNGKFMSFNTLEHAFKRYIGKSGVKMIRIHDLRHSHVSLLINKGSNQLSTLYIIAARIGDTVDMVLKTYGHMFPNEQKSIVEKLNFAF